MDDTIVFWNKGYNEYYGWVYEIESCNKDVDIPSRFSGLLTSEEKNELIQLLKPIKVEYVQFNPTKKNPYRK